MKVEDVINLAEERGVQIIDLKFTDLPGTLQHFSVPVHELTAKNFEKGFGFDGSSIRGFQEINESDMLVIPDPSTATIDKTFEVPTLTMLCNIMDPTTRTMYSRDPRHIAQKAEAYLKSTGVAEISYWGPELEFFVFDSVNFDQTANLGYYQVDSDEGIWNSGRNTDNHSEFNLGYKPRHKEGYFPTPPVDTLQDLRSEAVLRMADFGIIIEAHHHEVATGGQCEIDMRYDSLTKMADNVAMYKYVVKNVARENGKVATFMPKPLFDDNGTGMHTHQSLWTNGKPLFADKAGYAGLSQTALWYIGGLLKHAPAILAFAAPTTNSYKRLVPGFEAPVNLVYSNRNRSAAARIPAYFDDPEAKRIEFRCPDPSSNPYLAFPAMLMAGLDGIANKIDPGKPLDKDIYALSDKEAANLKQVPGSLEESLNALEADNSFLLKGNVFTPDLIETWIDYKRTNEVDPMRLRPHPYEFHLYFDA